MLGHPPSITGKMVRPKAAPAKRKNGNEPKPPPPAKRMRSSYTAPLKIIVGPEKESFFAHEDVLCANSRFFKAACSEDWKEGQEKTVKLPEVEPFVFRSYLDWVYDGDFDADRLLQHPALSPENVNEEQHRSVNSCRSLFKLWILADYFQDISCKNGVLSWLMKRSQQASFAILPSTSELLAKSVSCESSIFRWFVDWLSHCYSARKVEKYSNTIQVALLKRLAQLRDEGKAPKYPDMSDLSNYLESE